jgi:putative transposase
MSLHGTQFTSCRRLREAGLLGSMGSIGDCYDNSMMESFFGTLQLELLDEHHWDSPRAARVRDLRVDRRLVQPGPASHVDRRAVPGRFGDLHESAAIAV